MSSRTRRLRVPVAALAAAALVVLGPGTAAALDQPIKPLDEVVDPVRDAVAGLSGSADTPAPLPAPAPAPEAPSVESPSGAEQSVGARSVPSQDAPPPTSDDDTEGHETDNPTAPDHAEAQAVDADLAEQDAVDVAHDEATVQDDDSTTADSTLLALGGQEILGAHADSEGNKEDHAGAGEPLAPICEGSDGQVCLSLLYADAWATDDGTTSHSKSRSGVVDACVGGTNTDPAAECDGPVEAGVANSEAESDRNQRSGRTTASSESTVADVCVEETAGNCQVGAAAGHSRGESDSGGARSSASRDSYLLALDAGGEEQGRLEDPQTIAVQPACEEPSLLCVFVNQGETYVGDGVAGHAQEALHVKVLDGLPELGTLLSLELADTNTLVHNDGGEPAPGGDQSGNQGGGAPADGTSDISGLGGAGNNAGGGTIGGAAAGLLPNTGGVWSGLLALALFGIGGGSFLMARNRLRAGAVV